LHIRFKIAYRSTNETKCNTKDKYFSLWVVVVVVVVVVMDEHDALPPLLPPLLSITITIRLMEKGNEPCGTTITITTTIFTTTTPHHGSNDRYQQAAETDRH